MAPNFLTKLVKPNAGSNNNRSRGGSPEHTERARAMSSPSTPPSFQSLSVDAPPLPARPSGSPSSSLRSQPSVTVVPPSPQSHLSSFPSTREGSVYGGSEHASDGRTATGSVSMDSPRYDDGMPTPMPGHTHAWNPPAKRTLTPSSSTGNLRDRVMSVPTIPRSRSPSSSRTQDRGDPAAQHARAVTDANPRALVESPTQIPPEFVVTPTTSSPTSVTPTQSFPALLSAQSNSTRDSDSVSITSTASARKKRTWLRSGTNNSGAPQPAPVPPLSAPRSPKRKPSGLASALAASGLAMVNPGMMPMIEPPRGSQNSASPPRRQNGRSGSLSSAVPKRSPALSGHRMSPRSSLDDGTTSVRSYSRSRNGSLSQPGMDLSDGDMSVYGGVGASGDEEDDDELDDEDDQLLADLRADDIPVTGFAVASNKRNADFHDLFPNVPEGDYLIEDYGCALQREILIQGRIYISENHICFHANIFGWVTDLVIPIYDIQTLEKRMTAYVIPNAILITTPRTKYTFASFLARDTVYDVIHNIWRLARPTDESVEGPLAIEEGVPGGAPEGAGGPAVMLHKTTQCACSKSGQHYSEVAMDTVLPGTPERIYNLLFASGFIKDFMRVDQKLEDIQISDWTPSVAEPKCLTRNMSYIKPLNGSIGPRSTKCELRDETVYCDFDDHVITITTTRTPDVPSGGVFAVKTRTCIMWASAVSTKVVVTTQVEWTGRSFIKGIIEKSAIDGQKTYHAELDKAARRYIREHQSEFIPEGIDPAAAVAAAEPEPTATPASPAHEAGGDEGKPRSHDQRALQWAYDTFEGGYGVAKMSVRTLLDLIRESWSGASFAGVSAPSTTTVLYCVIAVLVASNLFTFRLVGRREEAGRRKELKRMEERERWVQEVVKVLWDDWAAGRHLPVVPARLARKTDPREELADLNKILESVEERVRLVRESLVDLD